MGLLLRSESRLLGPPLQVPQAEVSESTLVMQVYDFNRFAKHDIIGEVRLPLASVNLQHVIEQWSDLAVASKVEVGPGGWETLLGGMCSCLASTTPRSKLLGANMRVGETQETWGQPGAPASGELAPLAGTNYWHVSIRKSIWVRSASHCATSPALAS